MTKMAAMPIYGKKTLSNHPQSPELRDDFNETWDLVSMTTRKRLFQDDKYYNVYINMTLTYITARST